jgi:hypothetical protein
MNANDGARSLAQLPAVDLESTPLATRLTIRHGTIANWNFDSARKHT